MLKGKVFLIGAGPGDYKLMTLRGLEIIREADVIYYDRLVNKNFLKEAKEGCEFVYVGKESDNHTMAQDQINLQLIKKAKEGKKVARLKGGDPYVFGRGGEEAEAAYEEGIDFEVVPGITSAIGGLCYAGIPITHRDFASSFHVITAHLKDSDRSLDWQNISALKGTIVFLMGVSNLKLIADNLIKHGRNSTTPVAVINWATRNNQKVVTGTLENIYEKAVTEEIKSPSLIVVGDVVKLRDKLNFFENRPLFGQNIVVTRAREQSSTLVEMISELGGNAIEIPTIKIREYEENKELDNAIRDISEYSYIIFTSINGVDIFFKKLFEAGFDSRHLGKLKIAVIGSATGNALLKYGIKPDIVPEKHISEAIVEKLKPLIKPEDKILIPRANEARNYLVEELSKICSVTEVKTYETIIDESEKETLIQLIKEKSIDYITFTSSSTVENFINVLGKENLSLLNDIKLVSIGPVTSNTMQKNGLITYKEAKEYTIDGIFKCIREDFEE